MWFLSRKDVAPANTQEIKINVEWWMNSDICPRCPIVGLGTMTNYCRIRSFVDDHDRMPNDFEATQMGLKGLTPQRGCPGRYSKL